MLAIYKRELRSYFITPIGYVFIVVFMIMSGLAFSFTTLKLGSSDVSTYYIALMFFCIILVPLLTMKSMAEERRSKSDQMLLTYPVSITSVVLGKFFAMLTVYAIPMIISSDGLIYWYYTMYPPICNKKNPFRIFVVTTLTKL